MHQKFKIYFTAKTPIELKQESHRFFGLCLLKDIDLNVTNVNVDFKVLILHIQRMKINS